MLKTLRDNFKHLQWILWVVIAIFVIFVFVDWGMGSTRGKSTEEIAAEVGSMRITATDFNREYRNTEDRYRQMYGKSFSPELLKMLNLPDQVLNQMIDRRLMREEADRLRLTVTDAELRSRLLAMKDSKGNAIFLKDGGFVGEEEYRRMLQNAGLTADQFEAGTRDQMLMEKLNRFLTTSVFVDDAEVRKDFESRNVKAKISYVLRPLSAAAAPAVSDAEAETYFKEHASEYSLPEKRRAKLLLVETAKLRTAIKVDDSAIAAEYNKNVDSYKKPAEVHARHILYKSDGTPAGDEAAKKKADAAMARLKGGFEFGKLAFAESDDAGSKAKGGDLGTFARGRMVKEFEDAAFEAEPNALVGPVKSAYGYHVIQVLEKTTERVQPLFEVTETLRARLQGERASEEAKRIARTLSDRLAKMGKVSDDQLRQLTGPSITLSDTELVSRNDAPSSVGPNPAFMKVLFELEEGEVSEPVQTARGEALVKLAEVRKAGPATFADVKSKVIGDLAKKRQEEGEIAAVKEAMASAPTPEELAAKLGLKVETPEAFGRNAAIGTLGQAPAVADAAFAANVGEVKGPITLPGRGALVFKVLEKTPFDQAAFDTQKEQIRQSLRSQRSGRLIQAMLSRRRNEMKIVVNRELLKRYAGA